MVIFGNVLDEFGQLTAVLHEETPNDVQPPHLFQCLPHDGAVDIGIEVERYHQRRVLFQISVEAAIVARLNRVEVIAQRVQPPEVGCIIYMSFGKGIIKAVRHLVYWQAEYRRAKLCRRQVSAHLFEPRFAKHLDIRKTGIRAVESCPAPQFCQRALQPPYLVAHLTTIWLLTQYPQFGNNRLYHIYHLFVALLFIIEKP